MSQGVRRWPSTSGTLKSSMNGLQRGREGEIDRERAREKGEIEGERKERKERKRREEV